jgi:HK97 family phage portal protein
VSWLRQAFERRSYYPPVDMYGKWDEGMVFRPWAEQPPGVHQSMRLSAVFACIRLLTDAVATLPVDTFVRQGGVRRPARPRPAYLNFDPPQGSRVDYLSQIMLSLLTAGNAFVATPRDREGVPIDLIVLDPEKVTVHSEGLRYEVEGRRLDELDIMHIPGMRMPGQILGLSPLSYARETVGLGLAATRFGASFFGNGALPAAVIEAPQAMSQEAAKRFADMWYDRHGGAANANRVGVLTEGATLKRVSVQPNDAQFLETRQFQVPDIARFFGVPPHLIADASNSTSWGSGLAEQNEAFGKFSLRPWVSRIEDAHERLLTSHGLERVFVRLNMDALLRPSTRERYEAHEIGIRAGFVHQDEVRAIEDMPPLTPQQKADLSKAPAPITPEVEDE